MGMFLSDLGQHHNLEGIPLFRQPLFDFTSDVTCATHTKPAGFRGLGSRFGTALGLSGFNSHPE
jgi:hypothetical protein